MVSEGSSKTGGIHTLRCIVIQQENTTLETPEVVWLNEDGDTLTNSSGLTIVTTGNIITLEFNPLKASHAGMYSCQATVHSISQTKSASKHITVQQSKWII